MDGSTVESKPTILGELAKRQGGSAFIQRKLKTEKALASEKARSETPDHLKERGEYFNGNHQ